MMPWMYPMKTKIQSLSQQNLSSKAIEIECGASGPFFHHCFVRLGRCRSLVIFKFLYWINDEIENRSSVVVRFLWVKVGFINLNTTFRKAIILIRVIFRWRPTAWGPKTCSRARSFECYISFTNNLTPIIYCDPKEKIFYSKLVSSRGSVTAEIE